MKTLAQNHTVGSEPILDEGIKVDPSQPPKRAIAEIAKYPPISFLSTSSGFKSSFSKVYSPSEDCFSQLHL